MFPKYLSASEIWAWRRSHKEAMLLRAKKAVSEWTPFSCQAVPRSQLEVGPKLVASPAGGGRKSVMRRDQLVSKSLSSFVTSIMG